MIPTPSLERYRTSELARLRTWLSIIDDHQAGLRYKDTWSWQLVMSEVGKAAANEAMGAILKMLQTTAAKGVAPEAAALAAASQAARIVLAPQKGAGNAR